ncbi:MAG: hypothetical protein GY803_12790 [Chloroflexi bacterium]|nr:hypothetical protein [Chloroflexota bacterium]
MKTRTHIIWFISLLLLLSLACAQSGEIISEAEATARADSPVVSSAGDSAEAADFNVGDMVTLVGKGFLINLFDAPGGKISAGQEKGAEVEILSSTAFEDEIWYQIKASTGDGWVKASNLEAVETEDLTAEGPQSGDIVYLAGKGFLINMVNEAGGNRMIAGQERGAEVTIVEVTTVDGVLWYLVEAATGQGWVPAENISTEAP